MKKYIKADTSVDLWSELDPKFWEVEEDYGTFPDGTPAKCYGFNQPDGTWIEVEVVPGGSSRIDYRTIWVRVVTGDTIDVERAFDYPNEISDAIQMANMFAADIDAGMSGDEIEESLWVE